MGINCIGEFYESLRTLEAYLSYTSLGERDRIQQEIRRAMRRIHPLLDSSGTYEEPTEQYFGEVIIPSVINTILYTKEEIQENYYRPDIERMIQEVVKHLAIVLDSYPRILVHYPYNNAPQAPNSVKDATVTPEIEIRAMRESELSIMLEMEKASFPHPLNEEDVLNILQYANADLVIKEEEKIGYDLVDSHQRSSITIESMAIKKELRRQKIGSAMIKRLIQKLTFTGKNRITALVSETNLDAQLFFRTLGFRAVRILHNCFVDAEENILDEDGYEMQYLYKPTQEELGQNKNLMP